MVDRGNAEGGVGLGGGGGEPRGVSGALNTRSPAPVPFPLLHSLRRASEMASRLMATEPSTTPSTAIRKVQGERELGAK